MVVLDEVLAMHEAAALKGMTERLRSLKHWELSRESFWDWVMGYDRDERDDILDTLSLVVVAGGSQELRISHSEVMGLLGSIEG